MVAAEGKDRDGNVKQQKYFLPCNKKDVGATHRTKKHRDTWDFTVRYIMAWFGILLYHGSTLGANDFVLRY